MSTLGRLVDVRDRDRLFAWPEPSCVGRSEIGPDDRCGDRRDRHVSEQSLKDGSALNDVIAVAVHAYVGVAAVVVGGGVAVGVVDCVLRRHHGGHERPLWTKTRVRKKRVGSDVDEEDVGVGCIGVRVGAVWTIRLQLQLRAVCGAPAPMPMPGSPVCVRHALRLNEQPRMRLSSFGCLLVVRFDFGSVILVCRLSH